MIKQFNHHRRGYAVIIVLILLIVGTVTLVMLNRESSFFTKVVGYFSRSKKIQAQAESGVGLAKSDLRRVTNNSRDPTATGVDLFTTLANGGSAYDQGLMFDYDGSRGARTTIAPRIDRTDGDYRLRVYYFPENPCTTSTPCNDDSTYNSVLPKRFLIISEATNTRNGEVFTSESRVQVKLENFAEISFGVHGARCLDSSCTKKFPASGNYQFSPATYGRTYFDLPWNKIEFIFDSDDVGGKDQQHIFTDLATFKNENPNGLPFVQNSWPVKQQQVDGSYQVVPGLNSTPTMAFTQGYEEGVSLTASDDSDPSSNAYFSKMETLSNTNGQNLSSTIPCPATPNAFGKKEINICLKFDGTTVKRYNCKEYNDNFMGRIDTNIHPQSAYSSTGASGKTDSTAGIFVPGSSGTASQWVANGVDRYVGEHSDVYTGTDNSVGSFNTSGVIYCNPADCDCNVHIKGIVDGQVNVVAKNVVLEGDIRYKNQSDDSDDVLGVVAKNDIVIPAGVPQASTSASSSNYIQQTQISLPDSETPFTDNSPGGWPGNLAESYLGITNFIPHDGSQYVDRNGENSDYSGFSNYDVSQTNNKHYSSPTVLDLDGFMYAGNTVKVDGIFNPKDDTAPGTTDNSGSYTMGLSYIVCTNPPTCSNYEYKNPAAPPGDPKALFKADGTLVDATTSGTVQPLFYADGLNTNNLYIGQDKSEPTNGNYNNVAFQAGEEVARPLNRAINVFGGLNSKFSAIYDSITTSNGQVFRMGFKRKLIQADKRASYLAPPGYPSTARVRVDELYQKFHQGKSSLIPN